jgi:hypothetical protein
MTLRSRNATNGSHHLRPPSGHVSVGPGESVMGIVRTGLALAAVTALAGCTSAVGKTPPTTRPVMTTSSSPGLTMTPSTTAGLASALPLVRRFESLFARGLRGTFDSTYHQKYESQPITVFALQSSAGSVGGSSLQEDVFLHTGGYECGRVAITARWACSPFGAPNGYSAAYVNSFVPRRLNLDLQNALAEAPSSSVRVDSRTLSGRRVRCLVFRESGADTATWCLTRSGVLAYFTTDRLNLGPAGPLTSETVRLETFSSTVSRQMVALPAAASFVTSR